MYLVSFIILHYLSYDTTKACVDSILSTYQQTETIRYHIILVDNASPNNSYFKLKATYSKCPYVTLLQASENLGFAKGNNLGYHYAIQDLGSDFCIIANNDTEFHQPDFLEKMIQIYNMDPSALIGPDILNKNGFHQNPYRTHIITNSELNRWIRNRRLWLWFLYLDKYLHLSKHFSIFQKYYQKRNFAGKPNDTWNVPQKNVVLQGACILFTPIFKAAFPDYAFYPDTFMYCEEDILAFLCLQKKLSTQYTPLLKVFHNESVSTSLSYNDLLKKDLYLTQNILKSLSIFKRLRRSSFH